LDKECKRSVLIVSRDLSYPGGVVSVVSMLMNHFSDAISWEHFRTGPRVFSDARRLRFLYAITDCLRLISKVHLKRYNALCLNTSLDTKAILRDGLFMASLCLMGFKRTVVFIHGWDTSLSVRIQENRILRRCFRQLFNNAPVLIVLSSHFKRALIKIGIPACKIYVLTTMFEAKRFESFAFNIEKKIPSNLLFLSRFQPEKGAVETVEAFALLYNRYPDLRLIFAGDGPEREKLKCLVHERGMSDRVTFAGYIRSDRKIEILCATDIFILPTYYREGCPVSILEAMAAGLAVITTRVGGIPDVISHGKNGILLEDSAPMTIARAIEKLIADPDLLFEIRLNNRRKAFEQYEATKVASKVEKVFNQVFE
jgi:glycosyltransferase involved in cell wall biosynthesis